MHAIASDVSHHKATDATTEKASSVASGHLASDRKPDETFEARFALRGNISELIPSMLKRSHADVRDDDEDYKFIGVYSSHTEALRAVERLRQAPGFREFPALVADLGQGPAEGSGFYLNEHQLDQDGWASGFETV